MKTGEHNLPVHFNQILSLIRQCSAEEKELLLNELTGKKSSENDDWGNLQEKNLNKAYGADEPDYELSMLKEPNAEYGKR